MTSAGSTGSGRARRFAYSIFVAQFIAFSAAGDADRDYISIVGPSALYPLIVVIAERFGAGTPFKYPFVETTSTDSDLTVFCAQAGLEAPDVLITTAQMTPQETQQCRKHGVDRMVSLPLGHVASVLVQPANAPFKFGLSAKELFLAAAAQVPAPRSGGRSNKEASAAPLVANPYARWSDISPRLPPQKIRILSPARMTVEYDLFESLFAMAGCRAVPAIAPIEQDSAQQFKRICVARRGDEAWQTRTDMAAALDELQGDPASLAIMRFSDAVDNPKLRMLSLGGVAPNMMTVNNGSYRISWPIIVYIKTRNFDFVPGLRKFSRYLTDPEAAGPQFLAGIGLVPPSGFEEEASEMRAEANRQDEVSH